jgi:hypothetical protein
VLCGVEDCLEDEKVNVSVQDRLEEEVKVEEGVKTGTTVPVEEAKLALVVAGSTDEAWATVEGTGLDVVLTESPVEDCDELAPAVPEGLLGNGT